MHVNEINKAISHIIKSPIQTSNTVCSKERKLSLLWFGKESCRSYQVSNN